ncbi:hypothetical protein E2C01_090961 [Portunus trituberculatus]|uniref:Uncharacterized protein n=1 Tax=Portunus trituberculatus TaxID=210409 RepID=A0A5B7JN52_PORTR|nr:hypothetical protein [Portunus trituberculatus]
MQEYPPSPLPFPDTLIQAVTPPLCVAKNLEQIKMNLCSFKTKLSFAAQCPASPQRGEVPSHGAILSNQPQHVRAASPGSQLRLFVFSPFLSTVAARWPFFPLTPGRD